VFELLGEVPVIQEVLGRIGLSSLDIGNAADVYATIQFQNELAVEIPGVDGLAIVFGAQGAGITEVDLELHLVDPFVLRIDDFPIRLRFPREILQPVIEERDVFVVDPDESKRVDIGVSPSIEFVGTGEVAFTGTETIEVTSVFMIGDTGLILDLPSIGLVVNENQNITAERQEGPEVDWPPDFKGVWIPQAGVHYQKSGTKFSPTFELLNVGIGSGGFTGTISLGEYARRNEDIAAAVLNRDSPMPPHLLGLNTENTELNEMQVIFQYFGMAFEQSIPSAGEITGHLYMPFSESWMKFRAALGGPDGDLYLEIGGAADQPLVSLEHELFEIKAYSIAYKLLDEVHYAIITGSLRPKIEGFDWPEMKVDDLSISSEGDIDIPGGWLKAPEEITLDFHAFKIGISEIGFGNEGEDPGKRQWLGFSGSISLVEGIPLSASVEGLKFSWLKEPVGDDRDLKVSLQGIGVELEIPNVLRFEGAVAYREIGSETSAAGEASGTSGDDIAPGGLTGHLFTGAINLDLMPLKTEIDAQLIIGELTDTESGQSFKVFYIALQASLPVGIPLGPSLSIYELQGLFGVHVAPHRKMIDGEPEAWYAWYKAEPEYNVTSIEKWWPQFDHYAFGAGLMLGTSYDDGFSLNVGALVAVLIPGPVVMIEGRANFLKQRGDRTSEGALYMLAVFDGIAQSFQLNIDINYSLEGIVDVGGGLEALFFFTKDKAHLWHIYIGQRDPESKRIRAQVLTIVSANTYLMIDNFGIQFGAKAGVDWSETYGPVEVALKLIFEFYAGIFWKRTQFEGMIRLYGEITLKILGIGLQLILELMLEGKTPNPFYIYGLARIAIKLPFPLPSFDVKAEFSWGRDGIPDYVPHLKSASMTHHKAKSLSWELGLAEAGAPTVPVDAVPVLLFGKPIRPLSEVLAEDRPDADRIPYEHDEVAGWHFSYRHPDIELAVKGEDGSYDGVDSLLKQSPLRVADTSEVTPFDISLLPDSMAQEPKLQLWHYGPLDHANKYERDDYEATCEPTLEPETICVDWRSTPDTVYPLEFTHQNLNFVLDLHAYRSAAQSYRGELRTPSIWITLPEAVDYLDIRFSILPQFGLPRVIPYQRGIAASELTVDRISASEARAFSDGPLYDAVHIIAGDPIAAPVPGIPGSGGGVVIVPGDGDSGSVAEDGITVINQICYRRYARSVLRREVEEVANPHNPTAYRNELMLEPNRQYRLRVTTYVDCKPIEGRSERKQATETYYFATGSLPGTEYPPDTVTFADKQPNDLSTYVESTVPNHGSATAYYDYDVSVRFSDSYIERLYEGSLGIRIRNQNGQLLGSADDQWYTAAWSRMLTPGLLALMAAKDERGCPPEWQPHQPRYLYSVAPEDHQLGPNRLYRAELTSSMVTRADDAPLHAFEFVTSGFASFTDHMQSGLYDVDDERTLRVQHLAGTTSIPTAWHSDYAALNTALSDTRSRLADYVSERVGATPQQMADALTAVEEARNQLIEWHAETFAAIDAAVKPLYDSIGMQPRPLPPSLELVRISLSAGGYLLLLHSPEPLDYLRVTLSLSLDGEDVAIAAVWNRDQTQVFLVGADGNGIRSGRYTMEARYVGGGVERAELAPVTVGGVPVDEQVEIPFEI